jgi:putative colanic acid biosynthesis UDP-glucose lipid carrier transferase
MHTPPHSRQVRPRYTKLLALVRIADSAVIVASLWLAAELLNAVLGTGYAPSAAHVSYVLGAVVLYQFFADYFEVYRAWRGESLDSGALRLAWAWLCAAGALLALAFWAKAGVELSRLVTGVWFGLSLAGLALVHECGRWWLGRGRGARRAVVVGVNPLGQRLAEAFRQTPWLGHHFAGYYDDRAYQDARRLDCPEELLAGNLDDLAEDARRGRVDEIFVAMPLRSEQRIMRLLDVLADTTASVYFVPDVFVFNLVRSSLDVVQGIPCIAVYGSPFRHEPVDSFVKRAEDVVLAGLALAALALPMLLIGVAVRLESQGPAIFRQTRYGMRGEPIEVWKFRTMTVEENGAGDVRQATRGDPRVTRLGAVLRRYSLDELPQFINVLQGRMSVVGPRPHAVAHNEFYRKQISGYMLRHTIKPGITGLAQVNGCRGETDTLDKMERRIVYDLEYISRWRVWLDLQIIGQTVWKVAGDPQAY